LPLRQTRFARNVGAFVHVAVGRRFEETSRALRVRSFSRLPRHFKGLRMIVALRISIPNSFANGFIAPRPKQPRSIEFHEGPFPISGAGKVLKRDLRAPYWQGRERQVN
ncbi:MAG: hypothetical protein AAF909_04720, partial [Pseudomonadota bacterium]